MKLEYSIFIVFLSIFMYLTLKIRGVKFSNWKEWIPSLNEISFVFKNYFVSILFLFSISILIERFIIPYKSFPDMQINTPKIVIFCFVGPIIEEIIFRFLLLDFLSKRVPSFQSNVILSLLVSIISNRIFSEFVLNFFINSIYFSTRNLWHCITAHIIWNIFIVILFFISSFEQDKIVYIILGGIIVISFKSFYYTFQNIIKKYNNAGKTKPNNTAP